MSKTILDRRYVSVQGPAPRSCADCGLPISRPYARFCADCTYKPANRRGAKTKKYVWTPERDAILRQHYDSTVRGRVEQIARSLGWPKWVIRKRARVLGLGSPWPEGRSSHVTWSEEQIRFLLEHTGSRTPRWIAKRLGRSETSVILKIKRLGLSRRVDDGCYTLQQICEGFGVDHHLVERWIRRGWLDGRRMGTSRENDTWRFEPESVKAFICAHPTDFDIRKVDQCWFLDVLGVLSIPVREVR